MAPGIVEYEIVPVYRSDNGKESTGFAIAAGQVTVTHTPNPTPVPVEIPNGAVGIEVRIYANEFFTPDDTDVEANVDPPEAAFPPRGY